jgi:aminobenzoyl-glutamate transport protein
MSGVATGAGEGGVGASGRAARRSIAERVLDGVEQVGNRVPHPVLLFLYLIIAVIVLSQLLAFAGVRVSEQVAEPMPYLVAHNYYEDTTQVQQDVPAQGNQYADVHFQVRQETVPIQGLLTVAGIRYIFTSFVANLQHFGVIAVTFIAMMGAGAAEGAGLMTALIRKVVTVAPRAIVTFLIVLAGGLSSIASDAGYLILIPLAAAAFLTLGRHPLAGLAAGFAGVGGAFGVNLLIQPVDAMLTEISNEVIVPQGGHPLTLAHNFYFGAVSLVLLCLVATIITERVIEPRLGAFDAVAETSPAADDGTVASSAAAEARGLRWALYGFVGVLAVVLLATLPPGAPLRDPGTGQIIGNTPFMNSLLFIIALFFLISGICYGFGAGTFKRANDVIASITRTFNSLGGLVFMLLMVAQFIAYFNYSNIPTVTAIALGDALARAAIPAVLLLVGFILVNFLLTFIIPSIIPKWALFAPVFIPVFIKLGVAPQTLLAAYRVGDSPVNMLTPLMVYFPFIVALAQRYRKDAGVGTIISMMLPYALIMLAVWIALFVLWFLLGIPLGPGYPVQS